MFYKFVLILVLLGLALPLWASAHGGFEKIAGNTVVYITQMPVSPLAGEEVKFNFVFGHVGEVQKLAGLPVQISVIDTNPDEAKDRTIHEETQTTDVNGSINFNYTFTKQNYFDIDLDYADPATGEKEETGFLVQPRQTSQATNEDNSLASNRYRILLAVLTGGLFGVVISKVYSRGK